MEISVEMQILIFITAFLCGSLVGFIYDLFRIWRKFYNPPYWLVTLQDSLFWMISLAVMFIRIYNSFNSQMRLFEIFAFALGCFLYFVTISRLVIKTSVIIINLLKKISIFALKIFLFPLILFYKFVKEPAVSAINNVKRRTRKTAKFFKSISVKLRKNFSLIKKIIKKKRI